MNALSIIWRLLSTDAISQFSGDLAKLQRDNTKVVNAFIALADAAAKFAQAAKEENADLTPIIKMLEEANKK